MLSREQILADIDRGYFTTPLEWSEDISQADKNSPKFRKDILYLFEKKIKQYVGNHQLWPMTGSVLGKLISVGVSSLSEGKHNYDVKNFLHNNAGAVLSHVVQPNTGRASKEERLSIIKKVMGGDFDLFIKNAAEQIGRRQRGMEDIVSFLNRSDEFHPEWKEDVLRPMMKYFSENADPDHLEMAIKLNQKHPTPELEQFIEDEIDDNTKRDPYYYLSNISFNSLPERLQHKYIDGYLNENNVYHTITEQNVPYEKFKPHIDRAISDLLDRDSLNPIIYSPNPSYLSGNVKKILNHPEAKQMVWSLGEHGNTDPELAKRKAELAYEVFKEDGNISTFLNLTPDHQQDLLKKVIKTGAVKKLPTDHDSLELVADHLDSFDQSEKSQLGDWLRRFHERHGDRLKSAMEHELSDEQKEKITPFVEEHIPQFALQAPAKFWYEYEQKVRPHHFAVGKSLHTNIPETLTDHRGDTGSSDRHMYLLPKLRKYAQVTQKKIQDAVDQGILEAKTIDGKPHLWLYRGVAGHFAKSLRNLVGSGQLDPDDLTVVHHRNVEYPASPVESWSTSQSVAEDFANREIKGHPSRHGVIMGAWIPVDSIVHSGFISVYPNQPHAHEHENEFVAHIASDKPTRIVHSKDFLIDDNIGMDPVYMPTKTIKQPEETEAPPADDTMSKSEITDQHGYAFDISDSIKDRLSKHLFDSASGRTKSVILSVAHALDIPESSPKFYTKAIQYTKALGQSKSFAKHVGNKLGSDMDQTHIFLTQDVPHAIADINVHTNSTVYNTEYDTFVHDPINKSESDSILKIGGNVEDSKSADNDVVQDMLGLDGKLVQLLECAKFISGKAHIDPQKLKEALWHHENEPEVAALVAAELEPSQMNIDAIKTLIKVNAFKKSEFGVEIPKSIEPATPTSLDAAEEVKRSYERGTVESIKLVGKHSKGTLIARDPVTFHAWLLKPGSGDLSPSKGIKEETATQSTREAAYSYIARDLGLGPYYARAELLKVDGGDWAAIGLLDKEYRSADKLKRKNYPFLVQVMQHYLQEGVLHKCAALDYILGNPDRHAQNIMISKRGHMVLIDHGTTFAGASFSPSTDSASFVPFYLRYKTLTFNKLPQNEKLKHMPVPHTVVDRNVSEWIQKIKPEQIKARLEQFGINPEPTLARLNRVQSLTGNVCEKINELWIER